MNRREFLLGSAALGVSGLIGWGVSEVSQEENVDTKLKEEELNILHLVI